MAPVKRKGDSGTSTNGAKPTKRLRTESKESTTKTNRVEKESRKQETKPTPSEAARSSLVDSNEPPAFPRGGATALTPVERKQIQAQATRDVLFEQNGKTTSFSDSEDADGIEGTEPRTKKEKKKKSSTKSKGRRKGDTESAEAGPKIEGLNFKRVAPGSIILGQVSSVNLRDVAVSLPNNLTGYVPLTSVSSQLTSKIESLLREQTNTEDEDSESDPDGDFDLKAYLHNGQYVRVYVTSTGGDSAGSEKQKKHIELSLDPALCNAGMKRSDMVANSTIQASVHSVEDHGLIMDLGLVDGKVRGFVPTKELGQNIQLSKCRPGMVFLCHVLTSETSGRTVKMSLDPAKMANTNKHYVSSAPTIDCFLPGTSVEVLLTEVTASGLIGKVVGTLDVIADIVHSNARTNDVPLSDRFSVGQKIKGRLISTFPTSEAQKLGFSILEHVLQLKATITDPIVRDTSAGKLKMSAVIPDAKVVRVDSGMGLYLSLGSGEAEGFAHISNLSDKKVDTLSESSGSYRLGSLHKTRVIGYSPFDDLYLVSLRQSILVQPFLRVEDVTIGEVVKGRVQKLLITDTGVSGLLVDLAEGIVGLVPRIHMSDVQLQHPENKFREGMSVTARVLSINTEKKHLRLTLKKSLVNSDADCWKDFESIQLGQSAPGTLVKVNPHGAVVQFYGSVRGYLPVSEMSEAFINDATQHFREGQVVTINAIHVDANAQRLTVSCRDASAKSSEEGIRSLKPGTLTVGTVFEKSEDDVLLRLDGSETIARLELDHMADGSEKRRRGALSKIRVGQKLQDLLILEILEKRRIVRLSNKTSLVQAARDGDFLSSYSGLREGKKVTGFVVNITDAGVFIGFGSGITGLLAKSQILASDAALTDLGKTRLQPISANISSIDYQRDLPRFWLSQISSGPVTKTRDGLAKSKVVNPVDGTTTSLEDFSVGTVTKARIISIKDTQVNVELAKDVQGRIDVSELFDEWNEIKDKKKPLRIFETKQVLPVRILGAHDARNHRFLPITHRSGKAPVFELSAKPSLVESDDIDILTLDKVKIGSSWIAYVNNIAENHLWVNLSPNVRGRIAAMDVSDDLSLLSDLESNFPIGSALKVHVIGIDLERNRLDLSAKSRSSSGHVNLKDISKGMILPGRVTKASERQILVQLSETIVGAVNLIDIADDYSAANPLDYQKNDVVRVCVLAVDIPNKKVILSLRPSRVLSSSLPVQDSEISSPAQVKVNEVRRGFITNVAEKGVFVALSHNVTAFVRVSNLSDQFLKDWQAHFQRDALVKGKIIAVDAATDHVQMSLKESVIKPDYQPPLAFTDLQVGQVVSGKVAKVEDFGVFIVVDNSANVRGLCHRSEIAEQRIEDVRKVFNEGDLVKAKILKIEPEKRRVNFGLKASYFDDGSDDEMENHTDEVDGEVDEDDEDEEGGIDLLTDRLADFSDGDDGIDGIDDSSGSDEDDGVDIDMEDIADNLSEPSDPEFLMVNPVKRSTQVLSIGGFNWLGVNGAPADGPASDSDSDSGVAASRPKKKRKPEVTHDRTGDLDANGPQSADDYERLLLGEPDSSLLWLQYMAFRLELGEADQARQIAQRAIQTISMGQDTEKLNMWIAMLNLENTYGDDDSMAETFRKACEYNDAEEVHSRLASIYIQSGKLKKADDLFQATVKKFSQDPKIWINYATFLFDSQSDPERGRQLLSRALQTLPKHTHVDITSKIAGLEFRSPNGDPERGRTIFEGLLDSFPKRVDLWNVLLDLELKVGAKEQIRSLFERVFSSKLKNKQAKYFFKRWLEFEEKEGDERSVDQVKARAAEFVRQSGRT